MKPLIVSILTFLLAAVTAFGQQGGNVTLKATVKEARIPVRKPGEIGGATVEINVDLEVEPRNGYRGREPSAMRIRSRQKEQKRRRAAPVLWDT